MTVKTCGRGVNMDIGIYLDNDIIDIDNDI
jgi:hypothetical protein